MCCSAMQEVYQLDNSMLSKGCRLYIWQVLEWEERGVLCLRKNSSQILDFSKGVSMT